VEDELIQDFRQSVAELMMRRSRLTARQNPSVVRRRLIKILWMLRRF
jgi:hypothetical protein